MHNTSIWYILHKWILFCLMMSVFMWLLLHMYKNQVCDRSDNTFLTRVIFFVRMKCSLTRERTTKYSTKTLITLIFVFILCYNWLFSSVASKCILATKWTATCEKLCMYQWLRWSVFRRHDNILYKSKTPLVFSLLSFDPCWHTIFIQVRVSVDMNKTKHTPTLWFLCHS